MVYSYEASARTLALKHTFFYIFEKLAQTFPIPRTIQIVPSTLVAITKVCSSCCSVPRLEAQPGKHLGVDTAMIICRSKSISLTARRNSCYGVLRAGIEMQVHLSPVTSNGRLSRLSDSLMLCYAYISFLSSMVLKDSRIEGP